MKIRSKLLASHGLLALCIAVICGLILISLETTDRNRRLLEESYEHLREMNELNSDTNRMSEQIAELFSVGLVGREEVGEVSENLLARIIDLERRLAAELEATTSDARRAREREMLGWIGMIRENTAELGEVARTVGDLLEQGRVAEASEIYAERVEDGLDYEIAEIVRTATEADERRVLDAIDRWDDQTELLRMLTIGAVLIGIVLAVGSALAMDRVVSRPIARLAAAVEDMALGRSRPAVQMGGRDELGQLAVRFDQMAERIGAQQSALRAARDSLALDVAERTASLRHRSAELEAANARLTAINDTRTQFFADVSHELRTPLTAIRGQTEVALRQPSATPDDLRRTMGQIVRRVGQMARLVDDLLFLARSEAGVIGFSFAPIMMQDVMAEVVIDVGPQTRERDVTIALHQPSRPLVVMGDPERLRQVVLILLDNALSHAPTGSAVTLDLQAVDRSARLTVSDRGEGFSPQDGDRVFDRFYRGKSSGGRRGAGLGLPIARWIVEKHGGRIGICETDIGACVELILPLAAKENTWTS